MKICGIVVAVLYAGFMLFAVCKEKSRSISSALIAIGCVLIWIYALSDMVGRRNFILFLIIGMISISVGTFINGFKQNKIHIHHHVVRLLVETVITVVCWISG